MRSALACALGLVLLSIAVPSAPGRGSVAQAKGVRGTWLSLDFLGHSSVLLLEERQDGRLVGYLPADPSARIVAGLHQGGTLTLELWQEDPGAAGGGIFVGAVSPNGKRILGTFDEGDGPVPVEFERFSPPLKMEQWLLIDADTDAWLLASRLLRSNGSFLAGGFVGEDRCDFLDCAGDWDFWEIDAGQHVFGHTAGGPCRSQSWLTGAWGAETALLEGTWVGEDCTGSIDGRFFGAKTGHADSRRALAVLGLLGRLADDLEAESPAWIEALADTYLHDGRTKADLADEVEALFDAYGDLSATVDDLRRIVTANDDPVHPLVSDPARVEWRLVVTGRSAGGPVETILELDTADSLQEDLQWIEREGNRAVFVGNGASGPFRVDMPIVPEDTAQNAYGLWPYGVHGGGHPEGHGGWDVEYEAGRKVRAAADGDVVVILPNEGFPGQWRVTLKHRPGRFTDYDHLEALEPGIAVGAGVSRGDPLGAAGQTGPTHSVTHFAVRVGLEDRCPGDFLSESGEAVFDGIWTTASYSEELCEPLRCNDPHVTFPITGSWIRQAGDLAAEIEFNRPDPDAIYLYTLKDADGTPWETGFVSRGGPSSLDLIPEGGGPAHLARYDILSASMRIDWSDTERPDDLSNASVYGFAPD